MTRINVINVEELTDNFILAEYYELPRLFPLIQKAIEKKDTSLPDSYRYGSGHMRFFYNKITYLRNRHRQLHNEGIKRGLDLKVDPDTIGKTWITIPDNDMFWLQDYEPTPEALQLNRDRLQYRRRYNGGTYA